MEQNWRGGLKEHEKLFAFLALGFSVLLLATLAYWHPPEDGSGGQRIIDNAMGGLLLALGGAANALFRINDPGEKSVTVDNTKNNPVPTKPDNDGGE